MADVAISAHRGGSEQVRPESYEAFQRSVGCGAEYVEFDIRRTRDNVLVVFHDTRCPTSGRLVADLEYNELCNLVSYRVPRVDDVMQLLAGKAIGHLDLKESGYEEEVIKLAIDVFGDEFVATTLEDESVFRIKQTFPRVLTALSLGRDLTGVPRRKWYGARRSELFPIRRLRACGADWVAVNYMLARIGVLKQCAHHGINAMVWTVDADRLIDKFVTDPRVTVLVTNRPEHAIARRAALLAAGA